MERVSQMVSGMIKLLISTLLIITFTGCGGGGSSGGSGVVTATGVFKDSNVSGLSYVSGSQSGVTGSDGSFTYEVGQLVTFSIGGITIGTTKGKSVITPIDLVSGGNTNTAEVQNIIRFLMMLDHDGDPSNGIDISPEVRSVADTWEQVNFATTNLSTEVATIIPHVISADGGSHALPDANTAKAHLEGTLRCTYAGAYKGTFSGGDNGTFGMLVDATDGSVVGIAYSTQHVQLYTFSGMTPISYDQNVTFISGNVSTGATFSGQFTTSNDVSGTWENSISSISGTFQGGRIGGDVNATYRFTGSFGGDDYGLYALDVDSSDNVVGVAYSVITNELFTVSGSVSGSTVSGTVSSGAVFTGTLDKSNGLLNGSWTNGVRGTSGTYSGSGCKLN